MGFVLDTLNKFNEYYNTHINKGKFNRLRIFVDMIISYAILGSTVTDYFSYEFYRLNYTSRREYVVFRTANRLFEFLNDSKDEINFDKKDRNNVIFKDYIKRDWKAIDDIDYNEFIQFLNQSGKVVIKPYDGSCSEGIEFLNCNDTLDENEFNGMKNKKLIVEKYMFQHDEMARLNNSSSNTVRVTTVRTDDEVKIMYVSIRIGRSGMEMDNFSAGGIAASVDIETGTVFTKGSDIHNKRYIFHPDSKEQIVGFNIPFWKETIELVKELAEVVPSIRYTGWDILITKDGPILIEANARGMFLGQQCHSREGIKWKYDKVVKEIKDSKRNSRR